MHTLSKIFSPGTMDIYLAKTFAVRYIFVLIGLVGTLQALDLLAHSEKVLSGEGAVTSDLWKYVLLRLPGIATLFSPFVALLAAVLTLSAFNIHSEIVIMKAAGWSAFRILLPLILMSCLIGGAHFIFSETVTVPAKAELKNWKEHKFAANVPPAPDTVYDTWNIDRNNLVKAEKASRNGGIVVLDKITQYIRNDKQEITAIIFANFAFFQNHFVGSNNKFFYSTKEKILLLF
jgi:lipopolysaccharide export system permease protein